MPTLLLSLSVIASQQVGLVMIDVPPEGVRRARFSRERRVDRLGFTPLL